MKNATRLSPEVIERLQESAQVDDGIETAETRDSGFRRGVVSFPVSDGEHVMVRLDAAIFEWFRENAFPGEPAEADIHRVLTRHIMEQTRRAS